MIVKIDSLAFWDYLCDCGLELVDEKNTSDNYYCSQNMKSVTISKDGTIIIKYSLQHHDGCDEIILKK